MRGRTIGICWDYVNRTDAIANLTDPHAGAGVFSECFADSKSLD